VIIELIEILIIILRGYTVKNHLKNTYPKLGIKNRSEAIIEYLKISDGDLPFRMEVTGKRKACTILNKYFVNLLHETRRQQYRQTDQQ
jgi:hypothetical protein